MRDIHEAQCLVSPNHERNGDLFFDYYFDMKLHMTKNYRIILETEHFYISVEADGIQKIAKAGSIDSIANEDEWIDSYYE